MSREEEHPQRSAAQRSAALASALGAADPDYARLAVVERLTELRAAGRIDQETFERERRRLQRDEPR